MLLTDQAVVRRHGGDWGAPETIPPPGPHGGFVFGLFDPDLAIDAAGNAAPPAEAGRRRSPFPGPGSSSPRATRIPTSRLRVSETRWRSGWTETG
jgi:hypothetical protein